MDKERVSQIYVSNLPYEIREKDVRYKFEKYGEIKHIALKTGYCFIVTTLIYKKNNFQEYFDSNGSKEAISQMDGRTFEGSRLIVKVAVDKRNRNSSGPVENRDRMSKRGPQEEDVCHNCQKKGHW